MAHARKNPIYAALAAMHVANLPRFGVRDV